MKRFTILALVVLTLGLSSTALAQTAVSSTTLAANVPANDGGSVTLASISGIAVGDIIYVDQEAMEVRSLNSPSLGISRGVGGTSAAPHVSGATVYFGARNRFAQPRPRRGSCTRTAELYLPRIVTSAGEIWDCPAGAGVWVMTSGNVPALSVNCRALLVADMVDQTCFIADRPYYVAKIQENHKVAESAGTLTLIPRRQQGTEAAASGDALATAIDMVGAGAVAQTVKTATLTTTPALLFLQAGDRLGLDFTDDTAGELADVTVTFTLIPQ